MSKALVYYQNSQFYRESMFDTDFIWCETMSGNSWEILEEPTIVEIFQNNFLMTQGKQSKKLLGINKNTFIVDTYGILHTLSRFQMRRLADKYSNSTIVSQRSLVIFVCLRWWYFIRQSGPFLWQKFLNFFLSFSV